MGCKGSTVPIFSAENAPAAVRGGLVMSWQVCPPSPHSQLFRLNSLFQDVDGIWYFFGHLCQSCGQGHGRHLLATSVRFCSHPGGAAACGHLLLSRSVKPRLLDDRYSLLTENLLESPRWYIKKGRYRNAFRSLKRLRNTELQAARDLYYIYAQLRMEAELVDKQTNYVTRFIQLFTIPRVRRATLASFTVMIAQQMCGSRSRFFASPQ